MRNLFAALRIDRKESEARIHAAIDAFPFESEETELAEDLPAVMLTPEWRKQYELVHLQYEAIAVTVGTLSAGVFQDTHKWSQRTVEFEVSLDQLDSLL